MNDTTIIETLRRLAGSRGPADRLAPNEYHRVFAAVQKLSRALNHDRSIVEEAYLDEVDFLLGYAAFFLPRSVAQFRSLLPLMGRAPRRVVDLGSGPGPATLAAFEAGAESVMALDHSERALEVASRLTDGRAQTRVFDLERDDLAGVLDDFSPDTVVSGHVMNELFKGESGAIERRAELLGRVLDKLPTDGRLLVVDPALRQTSRALLAVRDCLVEAGYPVLSPCLRQSSCPALQDERDWCHAERPWNPGPFVTKIAEDVGVRSDVFKMSYFIFAPRPHEGVARDIPVDEHTFRIVSEPLHTKGRLRYFGCGPAGRRPLVMKERDARGEAADFAELQRYDVVSIGETVEKGDGFVVQKGEPAKRLATADEPFLPGGSS